MPNYTFRNTNTGEVFEEFHTISEREQFLKQNPHIEQVLTPIAFHSGIGLGVRKVDDNFNDVLKAIGKRSPNHKMNIK